jgi:hypothetical protein
MVKPTLLTIECHGNLSSGKAKATFVDFRHASKVQIWFVFENSKMVPIMQKILKQIVKKDNCKLALQTFKCSNFLHKLVVVENSHGASC